LRWLDGRQIASTGRGIESLTLRQLCNLAYAHYLDEMALTFRAQVAAGAKWDTDDPFAEKVEEFEEKISLRYDPAETARAMQRAWVEAQGGSWDETPVEASKNWWDKDVEFTSMGDLDNAMKGKG
jgi:hypothetical protein